MLGLQPRVPEPHPPQRRLPYQERAQLVLGARHAAELEVRELAETVGGEDGQERRDGDFGAAEEGEGEGVEGGGAEEGGGEGAEGGRGVEVLVAVVEC